MALLVSPNLVALLLRSGVLSLHLVENVVIVLLLKARKIKA